MSNTLWCSVLLSLRMRRGDRLTCCSAQKTLLKSVRSSLLRRMSTFCVRTYIVRVCRCWFVCIHMCVYIYYVCICIYVYILYTCIYIYIYTYVCICVCEYLYTCTYICIYVNTYTIIHIDTYIYTYIYMHICTNVYIFVYR